MSSNEWRADPNGEVNQATIAIDFDGVLHDYEDWSWGEMKGNVIDGSMEAMQWLYDRGYKLIIFTARDNRAAVTEWISKHREREGCDFEFEVTNVKPVAVVYIDDRGYRFTDWTKALTHVVRLEHGWV
jgi:hypothetical protein